MKIVKIVKINYILNYLGQLRQAVVFFFSPLKGGGQVLNAKHVSEHTCVEKYYTLQCVVVLENRINKNKC